MRFLILLFIIYPLLNFSQTIKGTIKDVDGEPIPFSNILIKENSNQSNIVEFTNARNGVFNYKFKKTYDTVYIEVNTSEYENESFIIKNPNSEKTYNFDVILIKNKITELKEVIVTSKKKSFIIREDTLTYNIDNFKDGTERKIEDVLKKLPGIEVNEKSGEIKYKGKSIETVTLDGDNLFGYNYTIGTKNINVDMVEQVQAIENYSENHLLKGIEGGEKVSINLKLKKGKTDYSGNIDSGLGINNERKILKNVNSNLLGISKKYKSFGTFSFNDIGINQTPFDYFSNNQNIERIKEKKLLTEKNISETLFGNIIDDERANINNLYFINYNNLFKFNKKLSLRTNIYYLNDKIDFNQRSENENFLDGSSFTTFDETNTIKKPELYRTDLYLSFITSKETLLEYKFKINYEEVETISYITSNNDKKYSSNLFNKDIFINNKLLFTKKINKNNAIQFQADYSYNYIPQKLNLIDQNNSIENYQKSAFKKKYFDVLINLIGKNKLGKYSFSSGLNIEKIPYYSKNNNDLIIDNSLNYKRNSFYSLGSINILKENWTIVPSYSFTFLKQKLEDKNQQIEKNLIFEPSFFIRYKVNNISFISAKASINFSPFSEEYTFSNPITVNNRIQISNTPSLELLKTENYNLSYFNNNVYKTFFLSFGINYQKSNGNYFSDFLINQNSTIINNFYLKEKNDNLNINFSIKKLVTKISTNFIFNSTYTLSNYKNIINTSEIRENTGNNLKNELTLKTAFISKLNFENTLIYNYNSYETEGGSSIINNSIVNTFKIKYKYSDTFFISTSSDYYLPNINAQKNDYLFLDFSILYKPKNKRYEFNLIGKNLLNNLYFSQVQASDFSKNFYTNNLISRYIFINFTYNL